ncbi:MAG TPA: glycoside hydrolase family 3 N-terminal domain-containing protein [Gaiellaceae bacterium]|nr:glycoside hydrolase family 3 N-terminal domain-containing protein [Gaiellaceae bacterium]
MDYRDLNGNGRLDPYEDPRRPVEERVDDLLAQLTLEEKAGLMYHAPIGIGPDGALLLEPAPFAPIPTPALVRDRHINHFNLYWTPGPRETARWHNSLQRLAEETRLGIPVTISSDPRHGFSDNPATSLSSGALSQWPEPIGLAAAGDEELVRSFGDIARQEYLALGIRVALHPMADLATEPRWARSSGTFGEDAELASRLVAAYIRGFQGDELGPQSVACMTKHFPGGGPQADGEDPHFARGKDQIYPGDNFEYHLGPFEAAIAAGTAQMMPYYGRPLGTELEEVGFGFNKQVITGMLRGRFGFDGVVCTDWGLVTDADLGDWIFYAKCWGVEELSHADRLAKIVDAGCDQLGGENDPALLVELVRSGRIAEARIDESVRRILRDKFRLGLFDDPYVDEDAAVAVAGRADFRRAGEEAQRRSLVLLANDGVLPVRDRPRLYVEGVAGKAAAAYGELVDSPAEAELAILRVQAPYEPREGFLESIFHQGSLEFAPAERDRILDVAAQVPTIVDVYLDRAAVLTEIAEGAAALLASFGASDEAVLDAVFGRFAPTGRLPFELPSSTAAVLSQRPDVPFDSKDPLFPFGHGLTY